MTIPGLPPADVPITERGDKPCSACVHHYRDEERVSRCDLFGVRCLWTVDDDKLCGPGRKHWRVA